eukprot:scaffold11231_cov267-Chaetoceros_neogracile.AAC.2
MFLSSIASSKIEDILYTFDNFSLNVRRASIPNRGTCRPLYVCGRQHEERQRSRFIDDCKVQTNNNIKIESIDDFHKGHRSACERGGNETQCDDTIWT